MIRNNIIIYPFNEENALPQCVFFTNAIILKGSLEDCIGDPAFCNVPWIRHPVFPCDRGCGKSCGVRSKETEKGGAIS